MKILALLTLIVLGMSSQGLAIPILNENVSRSGVVVIYPDNQNPNAFYIAPSVMTVAYDEQNIPIFSYVEYKNGVGNRHALVRSTMTARYLVAEIETAKASVLASNPQASFSAIPFSASQMVFGNEILKPLVARTDCDNPGGVIGAEQACSFVLNNRGRKVFLRMVSQSAAIVMNFEYEVRGVLRTAEGGFKDHKARFGIAARLGGQELVQHPMLFRDHNGDVIDLTKKK